NEPSGLDRRHHIRWTVQPVAEDLLDYALEGGFFRQQRGDVLEDDPFLREIWDVADQLPQGLVGNRAHTTRRKYSRVRAKPSSSGTAGCQPRSLRAWVMSGRRCLGSSTGNARNSIWLCEPASRTMSCASSSTVTSSGLPRLTGISSPSSRVASTPRTRSET